MACPRLSSIVRLVPTPCAARAIAQVQRTASEPNRGGRPRLAPAAHSHAESGLTRATSDRGGAAGGDELISLQVLAVEEHAAQQEREELAVQDMS